ncbi:MAG: thioredoxin family protein [Cyclobacteriaceae bacterium]
MKTILLTVMMALLWAGAPVSNGYEVGDTASDFKLKNVNSKMVSLADYKDVKGFIVVFDCNTCPYSKAYSERIIGLNKKYASLGFPVIAINPNDPTQSEGDSFDEMIKVAKKKGYDFPYLVDESQAVAKSYGATNTPHAFVLTKELKVAYIGAIDDNARKPEAATKKYVEEAVDALLAGKPVTTTKVKAIGCGIKWKSA